MNIKIKISGRNYNNIITTMIVMERLKTILCDIYIRMKISRKEDVITIMLQEEISDENGGIIGLKEMISAEFEMIAKLTFIE